MLELIDESEVDHKILAVPVSNPRFDQIRTIEEVPEHVRVEVEHFFEIYKELEGKTVRTHGWQRLEAAREAITKSRQRFVSSRDSATVPQRP
jgi:inorganic pyrophosphatase